MAPVRDLVARAAPGSAWTASARPPAPKANAVKILEIATPRPSSWMAIIESKH